MTAIQIDRNLNNIKSYKMCMLLQLTTWLKKKIYLQKWMFQSSDDCCMSWCQDVKLYLTLMWLVLVIHGCLFGYLFRKKDKHKKWWKLNLIIRNSWHLRKDVLHSKIHEISNENKNKNQKTMRWWKQNPVIFLKYWSCFIYFFIFNLIVCYDNVIWETF